MNETVNRFMEHAVTDIHKLAGLMGLTCDEERLLEEISERYPVRISEYYLSLIDWSDPDDPIRRMAVPFIRETDLNGSFDTSGEADNTVITGMQHKYDETVLILSTNRCAMYCRHCFRKRLVGLSDEEIAVHMDEMFGYIRSHTEISNVLISGGDAFMNSNETLRRYLNGLCGIGHLDCIRFGTRTPVVLPSRIYEDQELLQMLSEFSSKKQIYVVTQFNHPRELTPDAIRAIRSLQGCRVPVKNQTVLLKGVNDDPAVLGLLLKKLTAAGIGPYYIFQCRPVTGVKIQFQVPLREGAVIVERAKAMQNGLGKCVRYCMSHPTGKIEILGDAGEETLFRYHEAKDKKRLGRIFLRRLDRNQCWLDDEIGLTDDGSGPRDEEIGAAG